jgi:hypothetical protein
MADHGSLEQVTYTRKLVLGGLSVFMGRGTLAQSYFVAAVEGGFLMCLFRRTPLLTTHQV